MFLADGAQGAFAENSPVVTGAISITFPLYLTAKNADMAPVGWFPPCSICLISLLPATIWCWHMVRRVWRSATWASRLWKRHP